MRRFLLNLASIVLVGAAIGCAHQTIPAVAEPRLAAGEESVELLVEQFLDALANEDTSRLRALAVSYEEFESIVWPELDASRPGRNLQSEFVWSQYDMRSRAHFQRLIDRFGGNRYELESIRFSPEPRSYGGFRIHDDPVLTLIAEDGTRQEHLLFGAIIEHDHRFKIYGYSTD